MTAIALTPRWVHIPSGGRLEQLLCVAGDNRLYGTEVQLHRLNRTTQTWAGTVLGAVSSAGITASRADADLFFVGENGGAIGVIRRSSQTRERQILQYSSQQSVFIKSVAAMPDDAKLYITYYPDGGIWVVDPALGNALTRITLVPGSPGAAGDANDFALTSDSRRLYATVIDGVPRGVVEIDTQADTVRRRLDLDAPAIGLALSPDERRLFVTTQDRFTSTPSQNVLVDAATLTPLQFLPRPRAAGATRYDRGVLFRQDGKYIFVARDTNLDIYLHRQ